MNNKEKKYELTNETVFVNGKKLHRIRALKPFKMVQKGQPGGFIESEENLSQQGDCWIRGMSYVFDNARITDDAQIIDSLVCDNASISGSAEVLDMCQIGGNLKVTDSAEISWSDLDGDGTISGTTRLANKMLTFEGEVMVNGNVES